MFVVNKQKKKKLEWSFKKDSEWVLRSNPIVWELNGLKIISVQEKLETVQQEQNECLCELFSDKG